MNGPGNVRVIMGVRSSAHYPVPATDPGQAKGWFPSTVRRDWLGWLGWLVGWWVGGLVGWLLVYQSQLFLLEWMFFTFFFCLVRGNHGKLLNKEALWTLAYHGSWEEFKTNPV